MGTNTNTLDFLYESMEAAGIATLDGIRLLELGNQAIRRNARLSLIHISEPTRPY